MMIRLSARCFSITGRRAGASAFTSVTASAAVSSPVSGPSGSGILVLPPVEHGGHDLVDGRLAGVDDDGVVGRAQRGVGAGRVVGVAAGGGGGAPPRGQGGDP